jgi:PAS domain S-box-containing protein
MEKWEISPEMHPFVLFPLGSAIAATALAAAIGARDPGHPSNRLAAGVIAAGALWSVCQVLWITAGDPHTALLLARLSSLFSMSLAPLAFQSLLALEPGGHDVLRRWLLPTWIVAGACIAITITTPAVVADVRLASWGYAPVPGPGIAPVCAALTVLPALAVIVWLAHRRPSSAEDAPRNRRIGSATAMAFALCVLIEVALPAAGIETPRSAGAPVTLWGAITFWSVYRFRAPIFDPRTFTREILETLPVGVLLIRLDGSIRATNRRLGELAGHSSRELIGVHIGDLLRDARQVVDRTGEEIESEIARRDGGRVPISASSSPLYDESGEILGHVLVIRDCREVVSLRSRLVTSGRLAAVGQLAAGIAHEINNPIAYVRSNVSLLERHWNSLAETVSGIRGDPRLDIALEEGPELVTECFDGIDRVASTVRAVGGFSRTGGVEKELADPRELLDAALRIGSPQWRDRAVIERHYGETPLVPCIPQELMQVFLNLVQNATQALDRPGTIRLYTGSEGDRAVVTVEDRGRGIDPEHLERIFDPFFTTKPVGEGTGLGLAICRQIVERHGGEIAVDSTSGEGTRFRVSLPHGPEPEAA